MDNWKRYKKVHKTCSSLINIWSLSLSKRPWRPPLRGLINTTIGESGGCSVVSGTEVEAEIESSLVPGNRLSPAVGSWRRMESLIAKRRYCGIWSFFRKSSLSIRNPVNPHPLKDSIMEDRDAIRVVESSPPLDVGESISFSYRGNVEMWGGDGKMVEKWGIEWRKNQIKDIPGKSEAEELGERREREREKERGKGGIEKRWLGAGIWLGRIFQL